MGNALIQETGYHRRDSEVEMMRIELIHTQQQGIS